VAEQFEKMCESCGKRKATVHLTEIVDGQPMRRDLCEECYREQEHDLPGLSLSHVFAQLIEAVAPELKELSTRVCPHCGTNYLEFRQSMRLGCPHDYEVFGEALEQLLERIHGGRVHVGKAPAKLSLLGAQGKEMAANRLRILEEQMQQAVAVEDYERAARLRDQIRAMKGNEPQQAQDEGG